MRQTPVGRPVGFRSWKGYALPWCVVLGALAAGLIAHLGRASGGDESAVPGALAQVARAAAADATPAEAPLAVAGPDAPVEAPAVAVRGPRVALPGGHGLTVVFVRAYDAAREQVLHLGAGTGRAFARFDELRFDHDVGRAID